LLPSVAKARRSVRIDAVSFPIQTA
jgi:hypothetical protein